MARIRDRRGAGVRPTRVDPMSRRRIRIVLAIAALLVIAAASGFAGIKVGANAGEDAEPGAWSLLGVRDGGRTLLVEGPSHGSCDRTAVTADESRADRVVITSQVLTPRGGDYVCTLEMRGGEVFAVRLKRPILGRAVDGRRRKLTRTYDPGVFETVDDDRRMRRAARPIPVPDRPPPDVVGLRFRDARHALCNAGFEARRRVGRRHRTGMVVAQRAPVVQRPPARPPEPTCRNGTLPAVDLEVWAR